MHVDAGLQIECGHLVANSRGEDVDRIACMATKEVRPKNRSGCFVDDHLVRPVGLVCPTEGVPPAHVARLYLDIVARCSGVLFEQPGSGQGGNGEGDARGSPIIPS